MPTEMSNIIDKIKAALGDSRAPWYGSDLVSWVADLLEEYEKLKTELKIKDELLEWAWVDCGSQGDLTGYLERLEEMNKPSKTESKDAKAKNKA